MTISVANKANSRYTQGGTSHIILDKRVNWWDRETIPKANDDIVYEITPKYEFRPDLIAYQVYGKATFSWLVLQYNTIVDINLELGSGETILLPSQNRVLFDITNKPIGGVIDE